MMEYKNTSPGKLQSGSHAGKEIDRAGGEAEVETLTLERCLSVLVCPGCCNKNHRLHDLNGRDYFSSFWRLWLGSDEDPLPGLQKAALVESVLWSLHPLIFFFKALLKIVFILLLHWVFIAACGLSPVAVSQGSSLVEVCRLLTVAAALVAEHRLSSHGHRFSCSAACGIFPDQESIPCIGRQIPNHWASREVLFIHL